MVADRGPPPAFHQQNYPQEDPPGENFSTHVPATTEHRQYCAVADGSAQVMRRGSLRNRSTNQLPYLVFFRLVVLGRGTG